MTRQDSQFWFYMVVITVATGTLGALGAMWFVAATQAVR